MPQIDYQDFINQHQILVFDEKNNPDKDQRDVALAYQDTFLRYLQVINDQRKEGQKPYSILHFYPLNVVTVYLGAKDKTLAQFSKGVEFLKEKGYVVSLRSHGGLGVVEDTGILNFALATDNRSVKLAIEEAYQLIIDLVQASLDNSLKVEAYEIVDSYCPGSYDIVIQNKKVGGIAQRRFKDGVTTAAYIGVQGDQIQRGELMRDFYKISHADDRFPQVNPQSMTTLSDLIGQKMTVADYQNRLLQVFNAYNKVQFGNYGDEQLHKLYLPLFDKDFQRSQQIQA